MNYRPRKPNRWPIFDYNNEGAYFITICTHLQQEIFGGILEAKMALNELGQIADKFWNELPNRYELLNLDCYQIMPNHFHAIVFIGNRIRDPFSFSGNNHPAVSDATEYLKKRRSMMLSKAIGFFKMNVAREVNALRQSEGTPVWQRSFHDRIIRDQAEYLRIQEYINSNPANWKTGDVDLHLPG